MGYMGFLCTKLQPSEKLDLVHRLVCLAAYMKASEDTAELVPSVVFQL